MLYKASTNARNCTLGKLNSPSINEWPKTDRLSFQGSAVHIHLKESGHSFEDSQQHLLAREDHWFERPLKKTIEVKLKKKLSSNRHFLSLMFNAVLHSLHQQSKRLHHITRPGESLSCDSTDRGEPTMVTLGQ